MRTLVRLKAKRKAVDTNFVKQSYVGANPARPTSNTKAPEWKFRGFFFILTGRINNQVVSLNLRLNYSDAAAKMVDRPNASEYRSNNFFELDSYPKAVAAVGYIAE